MYCYFSLVCVLSFELMHDGMPYGQNQGQGQGHSREVDRQSPTGLIFIYQLQESDNFVCVGGGHQAFE